MRKYYVVLLVFLLNINCFSQYNYSFKDIVKEVGPPPEVTSLMQGYNTDANNYKGNVSFSIPIFEINSSLKHIVKLSYSSNSNKVKDRASRVGLGWNLIAGGAVSRTIREFPDESNNGFLNCYQCNEKMETDDNVRRNYALNYRNKNAKLDTEPDLYRFNFLNFSGEFIIDNSTFKAVAKTNEDLKIDIEFESNSKVVKKIIITDTSGNKYFFGQSQDNLTNATERYLSSSHFYQYNGNQSSIIQDEDGYLANRIVTWHLLEIVLSDNDKIKFNYLDSEVTYSDITSIINQNNNNDNIVNYRKANTIERVLKEIVFSQGKVEFAHYLSSREDLLGSNALEKVKVYNKKNELVKEFKFNYHYTENKDVSNVVPILSADSYSYKRLMLSNLEELDLLTKRYEKAYVFIYDQTALPSLHSSSSDLWGYYNNAKNRLQYYNTKNDKKVSSQFSKASLLTEVSLKTGGSVKYTYEPNLFDKPCYFDDLYINGLESSNKKPETYEDYEYVNMMKIEEDYNSVEGQFIKEFTVGKPSAGKTKTKINVSFTSPSCKASKEFECFYYGYIDKADGTNLMMLSLGDSQIELAEGTYTLRVRPRGVVDFNSFDMNQFFRVQLKWEKAVIIDSKKIIEYIGPGNRIKAVFKYDAYGELIEEVNYTYKDKDDNTTGKIFSIPSFLTKIKNPLNVLALRGVHAKNNSSDLSPNEAYNTNEYGYSEIQEYNSNYKINREYSVFRDPGFHFIFPFHLVIDMEWARGKLFSEQFYRITTEGYQLQKKTDFSYTFYNSLIVPNEWSLGSDVGQYSRACLLYRKTEEDKDIGQQYLLSKHKNIIPLYKMDRFMDLENPDDNRGYNTTPMQDYYSKSY